MDKFLQDVDMFKRIPADLVEDQFGKYFGYLFRYEILKFRRNSHENLNFQQII